MGTFVGYNGDMTIPEDKKEEFTESMMKVVREGGLMEAEDINMHGKRITLLHLPEFNEKGIATFCYSYFEDTFWETGGYNKNNQELCTNKVGYQEFNWAVSAAYYLYKLYGNDPDGYVYQDNDKLDPGKSIQWINYLLDKDFKNEDGSEVFKIPTEIMLMNGNPFSFWRTPQELMNLPVYLLSSDDRMYWLEPDTAEKLLSKKMQKTLKKWGTDVKAIEVELTDADIQSFSMTGNLVDLLYRAEQDHKEIYAFTDMFEEFINNGKNRYYIAAVKYFEKLLDDNWEKGKVINEVSDWSAAKFVICNEGRLNIKRYLAVMANPELREIYFGF